MRVHSKPVRSAPSMPKHINEPKMQDDDRAFFAANPDRKFRARWAGELEEMAFRKLWGISATEVGRSVVIVHQVEPGFRTRHPRFALNIDAEMPTTDADCVGLYRAPAMVEIRTERSPAS